MSTPVVPQNLQLPPSQRGESAFREQRRQKLKEQLLKRKTIFAYKQENQISSRKDQGRMTSENQVQEETKVQKLKAKMADKENTGRPTRSKHNIRVEKNCTPLKTSNELTSSNTAIDAHVLEDNNQTLQLPIKDDPQSQPMTLSRAFHLKNNSKKKQTSTEKANQDVTIPKKPVLGSYRGQIVQSKVNSFRKPLQVKDESSATKKLSATYSKVTKPQPINPSSLTVKNDRPSNMITTTKFVSTTSQNRQLVRPPIRSHQNNNPDTVKQDVVKQRIRVTSAPVKVQKGPPEKELPQLTKLIEKSKTTEKSKITAQRRHTIAKATVDSRLVRPKETAEERKARLNEWKADKGRALKRPSNSVVTQPEPEEQNEKPVESFWTNMAEEDEQKLFTEKVNKKLSECLSQINEGYPKEEILVTLNALIKDIPDAKKLVKYWICLARIEPMSSPIENIIAIYEKAILTGAQPIEEMRHAIVDILTMKSQEKIKYGEKVEKEICAITEQIQEVSIEDTDVNLDSEKPETENKHHKNVAFQDCEKTQNKTKELVCNIKTPNTETRPSCLIKYMSTTPCLQSLKKKLQFDETNSTFKELKFLTPVRRSQRLQEKTAKLPDMLKDHYPCVSSLEQITKLGNENDAFVCCPNAALCRRYLETETIEEN